MGNSKIRCWANHSLLLVISLFSFHISLEIYRKISESCGVTESKVIFNVGDVQFKNSWTSNGDGMRVTSNIAHLTKIKAAIISNQSKSWVLELTLIPNGPVKLGLYQAGILLEEELIQKL